MVFPVSIVSVFRFVLLYRKVHFVWYPTIMFGDFVSALGVMGSMEQCAISRVPIIGKVVDSMVLLFGYTSNGLFEGLPSIIFGPALLSSGFFLNILISNDAGS